MPARPHSPFERFIRTLLASRFLTISALLHLLLILLFGGTVLFKRYAEPPDFDSAGGGDNTADVAAPPQTPETLPPPPTAVPPPVTSPATKLDTISTFGPSTVAFNMPLPAIAPPSINKNFNPGVQKFDQTRKVILPPSMRPRVENRERTAQGYGAKPESEPAVQRALQWLQSQQHTDGTWGTHGLQDAFTGLALLCFLGHGETPQDSHDYGVVVTNAIQSLVNEANAHQGRMGGGWDSFPGNGSVYEHGIATYALCEAYTMTNDKNLVPVIKHAVDYIVSGQRPDGGWAYGYDLTPDVPPSSRATPL